MSTTASDKKTDFLIVGTQKGGTSHIQTIYLHIGLPKAASSSLQSWCANNREFLKTKKIYYPETCGASLKPKHQFLVTDLLEGHCNTLNNLLKAYACKNLLLSAEGLVNRFREFSPASLSAFRSACQFCDLHLIYIDREFESWVRSLYSQMIITPSNLRMCFAQNFTLEQFRSEEHVRWLGSCSKRLNEFETASGARSTHLLNVSSNWLGELSRILGLVDCRDLVSCKARENESPVPEIIEIIRQVNAMNLHEEVRSNFIGLVRVYRHCNHLGLGVYKKISNKELALHSFLEILSRVRSVEPLIVSAISGLRYQCESEYQKLRAERN